MEGTARIKGLKSAMRAMQAAFPDNPKQQQRIINGAMGFAARKSFLPITKQLAKRGDASGALSESLAVRAMGRRKRAGRVGGMEVVPVRGSLKAMAMYIAHHYTAEGLTPPASIIVGGIRHGHLVEFGHINKKSGKHIPAKPFLWPAAAMGKAKYLSLFAKTMKKRTETAVRRKAKKAKRR